MDVERLIDELGEVMAQTARRSVAVGSAFGPLMDDWLRGGQGGKTVDDLRRQAEAVADLTEPESEAAIARRNRAIADIADLYLSGSGSDRARLESVVGSSPAFVTVMRLSLRAMPFDADALAERFALAAVLAPSEDWRDLMAALHEIVHTARYRDISVRADLDRVEALASPAGVDLFRGLRSYFHDDL